jgi:nucleotide-binding universal stress UspA family protein
MGAGRAERGGALSPDLVPGLRPTPCGSDMACIAVASDLSLLAERALPAGERLARALGVDLVLLHVVHDPVLAPALTTSVEQDVKDAESALAALAARVGAGVTVRVDVTTAEEVVDGIAARAAALDARYLVIASHGRSGWQRLRLGSVAASLVRRAAVPVVCVPAGES